MTFKEKEILQSKNTDVERFERKLALRKQIKIGTCDRCNSRSNVLDMSSAITSILPIVPFKNIKKEKCHRENPITETILMIEKKGMGLQMI